MRKGEVQQIGTPYEVYNEPGNLFVARFIGSPPMNILDMEILDRADRKIGRLAGRKDKNLIAGLRPEDIKVVPENEGILNGKLKMIGPVGGETLLYLSVEGKKLMAKVRSRSSMKAIE